MSTPTVDTSDAATSVEVTASLHELLDHVVDNVPGVVGAVVSSADGFSLAARVPPSAGGDAASIAAMSAAVLGLADRLVRSAVPGPSRVVPSHGVEVRSDEAHGYVFAVAGAATLTILTTPESERSQILAAGRELTGGLLRLLGG